jgi:17beta-estradiol 17-dehydrogenase / very-long-chain 3-oxoacyl-CoA reductase
MLHILIQVLAFIGSVAAIRFAYWGVQFLTFHLIKPARPLHAYKRAGTNAYALITGSSAGIGLGISMELVRQGFDVILLGHLPDELAEAAATLKKIRPGALVRTLVINAITATSGEIEAAVRSIADFEISILVNNVGGNFVRMPPVRQLSTFSCAEVDAVIDQNARFMARLTALMLPLLSRRRSGASSSERSLILSIASAAMYGAPWMVMYSATKAFDWAFSVALARELAAYPETLHIDSLAVVPGDVHSQGNCRGLPADSPRWDDFGRNIVLKTDGALWRGWRDMRPDWWHDLELSVFTALSEPEGIRTRVLTDKLRLKRDSWGDWHAKNQ